MKRSGMDWKRISIAREYRRSAGGSVNRWRARSGHGVVDDGLWAGGEDR